MVSFFSPKSFPREALRYDLRAIWLLRSNALLLELRFWLVILGYDPQARRFRSASYLVYALILFFIWGGMVFLWFTDVLAYLLTALPEITFTGNSLTFGSLAILAFLFSELYQVTKRSPLAFTEQDAHLICMTPIDRRWIVLTWFVEAWVSHTAWLWIFFAALASTLFQIGSQNVFSVENVFHFVLAGLRAISIVIPFSLGMLALIWPVGLWRLRAQPAFRKIAWGPTLLFVLIFAGLLRFGWPKMFDWVGSIITIVGPILGHIPYIVWIVAGLFLAIMGIIVLWSFSKNVNLEQAASETQVFYSLQAARFMGRTDLASDLFYKVRLGVGRSPSRLPVSGGWPVFIWRNLLQVQYLIRIQDILLWIGIIGLNVCMLFIQGWDIRVYLSVLWVILILQILEPLIQRYLSRWWVNRTLPFKTEFLIVDIAFIPVVSVWLAGLVSLFVSWGMNGAVPITVIWLYLVTVPGVVLCGVLDVLRHAKSIQLISGICPGPEMLAIVLSLLLVFLYSGGTWLLLEYLHLPWIIGMAILVPLSIAGLYGLLKASSSKMKHI